MTFHDLCLYPDPLYVLDVEEGKLIMHVHLEMEVRLNGSVGIVARESENCNVGDEKVGVLEIWMKLVEYGWEGGKVNERKEDLGEVRCDHVLAGEVVDEWDSGSDDHDNRALVQNLYRGHVRKVEVEVACLVSSSYPLAALFAFGPLLFS